MTPVTEDLLRTLAETWGKKGYRGEWMNAPMTQRRWEYETVIRMLDLKDNERVLDAAGGMGYLSSVLAKHMAMVVHNDINVAYSQPDPPNVVSIVADVCWLDARRVGFFDAIACVSSVEHMPRDTFAKALQVFRLLTAKAKKPRVGLTTECFPDGADKNERPGFFHETELVEIVHNSPWRIVRTEFCPFYCADSGPGKWRPVALLLVPNGGCL